MKETGLFDEPQPDPDKDKAKARRSDPRTSHDAAKSVNHIRESQEAILRVMRSIGRAATDTDIFVAYAKQAATLPRQSPSGLRTRRGELVTLGRVVDSGQTETLESGRKSILWRLA